MRKLSFVAGEKDAGRAIKSILKNELHLASSLISRVKLRETGIILNGTRAFTNARVRSGDVLEVEVGDLPSNKPAEYSGIPICILFEDDDIIIIDKPAGMAIHGSSARGEITLKDAAASLLGPGALFHPVSRLDRGTSGVMAIAKSGYIHDRLRRILHNPDFRREYVAVSSGVVEPSAGTINLPISRLPGSSIKRVVSAGGSPSLTNYEMINTNGSISFLRIRPETGRTHQIRVHMAHIGFPLLGDWLYGEPSDLILRPALHSSLLVLRHPVTGEVIEVSAPIPEDMRRLLTGQRQE